MFLYLRKTQSEAEHRLDRALPGGTIRHLEMMDNGFNRSSRFSRPPEPYAMETS